MADKMTFDASNGREYLVNMVNTGDSYGRNFCSTHKGVKPMIEFYLLTEGREDYFISRYYLSTFRDIPYQEGLCLDGGQRELDLDKFDLAFVKAWLYSEVLN